MPRWTNWSGRHRASPAQLHHVRSEEDAVAVVRAAREVGRCVRVAGAGHSHQPLVPTDGTLIDASGLAGVLEVDASAKRAWVGAGTFIHALGRPLHDAGLALVNQGDIDRQAIAGATATGTHGTGRSLRNLSAAVTGVRLVLADGRVAHCDASSEPELWQAARLHLGAFGVVTRLQLQLRDAYRLEERGWTESFEAMLPRIEEHAAATRHFEFFWYPGDDSTVAKATSETEAPPRYPVGDEGTRCAWSHEVLSSHRPHLHTEMEYSVPEAVGPACLAELRALVQRDFPDLRWPIEYRSLATDDVWLSTAYDRPTVTISVHQGIDAEDEPLFRACERVFAGFEGRPHWGKVHFRSGTELAALHPRWQDWWRVRDAVDPEGLFLNEHLEGLRAT